VGLLSGSPNDEPGEPASDRNAERRRKRRMDFFAALGGMFVFGWGAAYLGSQNEIEWLYFVGLGFVSLPLLLLMLWLGSLNH